MYDFLRTVDLFAELSDSDLESLCLYIVEVRLAAGEELFSEGDAGDKAYIIREGELEILTSSGGREILIAVRHVGELIGEMALLEDAPRSATVRAHVESLLFAIDKEHFDSLVNQDPTALKSMLRSILARLREQQDALYESERMAILGTLTAETVHDLNNPTSAIQRAAEQLGPELESQKLSRTDLERLGLTREQMEVLSQERTKGAERATDTPELDALARSDREAELEFWLEDKGVEDAWEIAPTLVDRGFEESDLALLGDQFSEVQLPHVVSYLSGDFTVQHLLAEIRSAAASVSNIIKAYKSYAYLDQAPVQDVSIHEGLDGTLLILGGKLKEGISVRKEYAEDLPQIMAYGSELNQVWTNLIKNAADAMDGKGEIILRTRSDNGWVIVEIQDNGPGVPSDLQERIFETGFTTKSRDKGTGLGLSSSRKIVEERHRGEISLTSEPGNTRFEVRLPLNFENI
ncbi:MAG: sensor histidine kinase [Anaerolineales bacterium]